MDTINWGIIGCGDVCEVKSGPAFQKVPHAKLVAVMRRNEALAADFASRHGVPRWYGNATDLINDPEVNAVYIATPPSTHAVYTLQALGAGKPVYVEKPMAHHSGAAKEMAEAVIATGGKLVVAHYRRQQPLFLQIKQLLEQQAFGTLRTVNLQYTAPASGFNLEQQRVQWRVDKNISGGGFFHDLAPHQLDLLCYFLGAPEKVQGIAANTSGMYEAPDAVSGSLLFPKGVLATCNWVFAAPDGLEEDYCTITGSRGQMRFPIFGKPWLHITQDGKTTTIGFEALPHVQEPMIAAVTRYFLDMDENPCPADAGVLVIELMEAMTR